MRMNQFSRILLCFMFLVCPASVLAVNSIDFADLSDQIISTSYDFTDSYFEITNNSGQVWTDFHLSLYNSIGDPNSGQPSFGDPPYYGGPGNYTTPQVVLDPSSLNFPSYEIMDILGLNIPTGSVYSFSLNIGYDENNGWQVIGYPTVNQQVPEPSLMLLLGAGVAVIAGTAKKLKAQSN